MFTWSLCVQNVLGMEMSKLKFWLRAWENQVGMIEYFHPVLSQKVKVNIFKRLCNIVFLLKIILNNEREWNSQLDIHANINFQHRKITPKGKDRSHDDLRSTHLKVEDWASSTWKVFILLGPIPSFQASNSNNLQRNTQLSFSSFLTFCF